jgi:hypothetical protein
MKKIIIVAILLFSLQNFAQKTFVVYNFTGQTVQLADIITKPSGAAIYPEFHSKPFGLISIPPGGSYTLENTANVYRFPFYSPTSAPYINKWERLNSSSSVTPLTSPVAWPLGSSQIFTRMLFYVGNEYRLITAPTLGSGTVTGTGWTADYVEDNPAPNVYLYTIVVY